MIGMFPKVKGSIGSIDQRVETLETSKGQKCQRVGNVKGLETSIAICMDITVY